MQWIAAAISILLHQALPTGGDHQWRLVPVGITTFTPEAYGYMWIVGECSILKFKCLAPQALML